MTWPKHYLFTMGGPLYVTERWSCGLRFIPNNWVQSLSPAEKNSFLDDAVAPASAFVASATAGLSQGVQLDTLKFNEIGEDGLYADQDNTYAKYLTGTLPKGSSVSNVAPQVSIAVTLLTAAARGRASKGRIFVPCPVQSLENDGRLTAVNSAKYATSVQVLINALNDNPGLDAAFGGLDVHVVSGLGAGEARKVTGVSAGRVYDTQRRRRRSLVDERGAPAPIT